MQAIETKYIGPTSARGSRIKALCQADDVTVPYEYGANGSDGAHDLAAIALIRKMEWWGVWARGGRACGNGNVYVCISREPIHHLEGVLIPPDCYLVVEGEES